MQLAETDLGINPNALGKLDSQRMGAEVCRDPRGLYTASLGNQELSAIPAHHNWMCLLMVEIPECDYLY